MKDKSKKDQQIRQFEDAARILECDESEERFDAALKTIALFKKTKEPTPLDEFWERARIAAEADGYDILTPSFPISEHE
jgi:hypothetical protein